MEQVLEHLALDRHQVAIAALVVAGFVLVLLDRFLDLGAQRLVVVGPAKKP
jgi:hypothetical protein